MILGLGVRRTPTPNRLDGVDVFEGADAGGLPEVGQDDDAGYGGIGAPG
jgi:hypothetical protein